MSPSHPTSTKTLDTQQAQEAFIRQLLNGQIELEDYVAAISKLKEPPVLASFDYARAEITGEHAFRVSQERIERKLDILIRNVATRDDVIQQVERLLLYQQEANRLLQGKLEILRKMQANNVPHKRLARYASASLAFFIFAFLSSLLFHVSIVTPFWNNLGMLVSSGFLVMAFAMSIDWQEHIGKK